VNGSALRIAVLIARVVLGAIFIAAGSLKMGHFAQFAQEIAGFRLLPRGVIAPMAILMPFVEIVVGAMLVAGFYTRAAATIAAVLLFVFDAAIASAVMRGLQLSCGCFGPNDTSVTTWGEVARDAIFVLLAVFVALRPPGALSLDRRIGNAT
jgi:uncharacterized membrane protein YphA (DoxX/SURF4 family)